MLNLKSIRPLFLRTHNFQHYRRNNFPRPLSSTATTNTETKKEFKLNKNVAFLFPGQGAQYVGMAKDLLKYPEAEQIIKVGSDTLGKNLIDLMFNGPLEELTETKFAQPAILLHSMAIHAIIKKKLERVLPNVIFMLGHSLGEFSALCASEAITLPDALKTVYIRGKAMSDCISSSESAMVALTPVTVQIANNLVQLAQERTGKVCQIANINSQSQIVLSGHVETINEVSKIIKELEYRIRPIRLTVGGPFHTSLMQPATVPLEKQLNQIPFKQPKVPIISNVTAQEVINVDSIKSLLINQVYSPVQWYKSIIYCKEHGVELFLELGPGKVLSTLSRQIDPNLRCISVGSVEEINYLDI